MAKLCHLGHILRWFVSYSWFTSQAYDARQTSLYMYFHCSRQSHGKKIEEETQKMYKKQGMERMVL